jgi:hypothetical protein
MTNTLREIVTATGLASGATLAITHHLSLNSKALVPDRVEVNAANFTVVSCTSTTLTVRNDGPAAATCNFLLEFWHTIDRVFGNAATGQLTPAPFVVTGAGNPGTPLTTTTDPRLTGLAASIGVQVLYLTTNSGILLQKYASWNTAWRVPGEDIIYPPSATLFAGYTKLTPTALYLMEVQQGDVYDTANANTLTVANAPAFAISQEGKKGIWYDGVADAHNADVNDPGLNSFVWGAYVAVTTTAGALVGFVGRLEGTAKGFALYYTLATNQLTFLVRDGAGVQIVDSVTVAALSAQPRIPCLISAQMDRTTSTFRMRVSRLGVNLVDYSTPFGAIGTMTVAGQKFGFGAIPSAAAVMSGGASAFMGYYITGAQAEGANVLRDLHLGLGAEL